MIHLYSEEFFIFNNFLILIIINLISEKYFQQFKYIELIFDRIFLCNSNLLISVLKDFPLQFK